MIKLFIFNVLAIAAVLLSVTGNARADSNYILSIKDHKFAPETLEIPAGQKVKVVVDNQDATPAEFESYELNREKIIPGNSKGTVFIGPLEPGTYPFFDEFHQDTTKGKIVAK